MLDAQRIYSKCNPFSVTQSSALCKRILYVTSIRILQFTFLHTCVTGCWNSSLFYYTLLLRNSNKAKIKAIKITLWITIEFVSIFFTTLQIKKVWFHLEKWRWPWIFTKRIHYQNFYCYTLLQFKNRLIVFRTFSCLRSL